MTFSTRICLLSNCIVICGQCSCYLYSLTHTLTYIDTDWLWIVRVCALLGLHTFFIHTIHITINIYDTFIYKRKKKTTKTMRRSPSKRKKSNNYICKLLKWEFAKNGWSKKKKKKKNENKRKNDYCEKRDSLNHKD